MIVNSGCSTNKTRMSNKQNMSSFLLTEIALDLLGNKFYDIYGNPVQDLQTLYCGNNTTTSSNERNLASLLGISDTSLNAADNFPAKEIITLDEDDVDEGEYAKSSTEINSTYACETQPTETQVTPPQSSQDEEMDIDSLSEAEEEVIFTTTTEHVARKRLNRQSKSPIKGASTAPKRKVDQPEPNQSHQTEIITNQKKIIEDEKLTNRYNSANKAERLECILKSSSSQYAIMKTASEHQKVAFFEQNKRLIQMRSLKHSDFRKRFYNQQKISLIEESSALMQFIKFIKNEKSHPREILVSCADDILKAKDIIS